MFGLFGFNPLSLAKLNFLPNQATDYRWSLLTTGYCPRCISFRNRVLQLDFDCHLRPLFARSCRCIVLLRYRNYSQKLDLRKYGGCIFPNLNIFLMQTYPACNRHLLHCVHSNDVLSWRYAMGHQALVRFTLHVLNPKRVLTRGKCLALLQAHERFRCRGSCCCCFSIGWNRSCYPSFSLVVS